jgi:putative Mg2+ transporter-C (MgtC) family protein
MFVARGSVYGLTTAASLWMTSSIGMAAGAGMYQIALVGVAFAVLIITVLWLVMRFLPPVESSTQKNASAGHEE